MPNIETTAAVTRPRHGSTTSADGVTIGWWSFGSGPGLVIVHGAMQSGMSQRDLAQLLPGHTVHLIDRRGRGASGPWPANGITPEQEVADVAAVAAATGSGDLMGVSSGAILLMRAALATPAIRRIAIFEPPLAVDDSLRLDRLPAFDAQSRSGDIVGSMVTALKLAELGPSIMLGMPDWMLRPVTKRLLAKDDAAALPEGFAHVRDLARALPADFEIVSSNAHRAGDFAAITVPTLLLRGTKTRPYLSKAVGTLASIIPGARMVELQGTTHGVTQNRDQWGRPDLVAPVLADFFA
jgi:pimeloyl-ACP methyl ester carboxylesterase